MNGRLGLRDSRFLSGSTDIPGAGRTVLASHLIEHVKAVSKKKKRKKEKSRKIACVYFSRRGDLEGLGLFRFLLSLGPPASSSATQSASVGNVPPPHFP